MATTSIPFLLERLRIILQDEVTPKQFESILAAILTETLQIDINVAKSGFQHGADSGTAGRQGRALRFEMKRYGESTHLNERDLRGGFHQALQQDPSMEAWVMVVTKAVPEQITNAFRYESEESGVPVLIFDWSGADIPRLAALCTIAPDAFVLAGLSEAADIAKALREEAKAAAERVRRDLDAWCLGYESLRMHSHKLLNKVWFSSRTAKEKLAQDIAGGSYSTTIERPAVSQKFDVWWSGRAAEDAPLIVTGLQGMGKSWASVQWAFNYQVILPVTILLPASTFTGLMGIDLTTIKTFIADKLYGLTERLTPQLWFKRLSKLLSRPAEQGPAFLIIIDGINQEPSVNWNRLFEVMQADEIAGLVRIIATTRQLHFTQRLGKLSGLIVSPVVIELDKYDDSPGGELEQRLAAEGFKRSSLTEELISIARTPRLFQLVVRLHERLQNTENITIHRLLWEYGCDSQGLRNHMQLSQQDWLIWLDKVAEGHRQGKQKYNTEHLAKMLHRDDLNCNDISRRVSEVADTVFATLKADGQVQLSDLLISHALGAALLNHLLDGGPDAAVMENRLTNWLDPISGLDEKPNILRAAVSLLLERSHDEKMLVMSLLVTHWLNSQNLAEEHHYEVIAIAPQISDALLDVIETSDTDALESGRLRALNALSQIPVENKMVRSSIIARCTDWLLTISRDVNPRRRDDEGERVRASRLIERVGHDSDGPMMLLGRAVTFRENMKRSLREVVPQLLRSGPLSAALPLFEAAALSQSVNYSESYWNGLKWLCWFNDDDFEKTALSLKNAAARFAHQAHEPGVHPELKLRVAFLLLRLSGHPELESHPLAVNPPLDSPWDYQSHYLNDLTKGMFNLEMRHAPCVMANTAVVVEGRLRRLHNLLPDPAFPIVKAFVKEIDQHFSGYALPDITEDNHYFKEHHLWDDTLMAAARFAPTHLFNLAKQQFDSILGRPKTHYPMALLRAQENFLLLDKHAYSHASVLRNEFQNVQDEQSALNICALLIFETAELPPLEQYCRIIDAELPFISTDLAATLKPVSAGDVDRLIEHYEGCSRFRYDMLLILLSHKITDVTDTGWTWLINGRATGSAMDKRRLTKIMYYANRVRLGKLLESECWNWQKEDEFEPAHFGSLSLAEVLSATPFQSYANRIAPWTLFTVLSMRTAEPADYMLAASLIDGILFSQTSAPPDLDAEILVTPHKRKRVPFLFSITPQHSDCKDPAEQFEFSIDKKKGRERHKLAVDRVVEKIRHFRRAGASLYLCDFDYHDLVPALPHIGNFIDKWVSSTEEDHSVYSTRIQNAEGFYLSLCEAMIETNYTGAIVLWRKLGHCLKTQFVGKGHIEQFLQLAFINKKLINSMAGELFELKHAHSDDTLYDFALAAHLNDGTPWLKELVKDEMSSEQPWRQLRARYISSYLDFDSENYKTTWPEGPQLKPEENRANALAKLRRDLRFAKHWWNIYTSSEDDGTAFSAWCMLLQCADRRTYSLLQCDLKEYSSLFWKHPKRWLHVQINFRKLEEVIRKKDKNLDSTFLGRDIYTGIHPWDYRDNYR
ncbi:hypothetical protein [Pantoea sp. App145]|uniref:hypothetical protein n=1 Tax=Pantoea sp. App145 TaxID=3071567 RepID=UPI003A7F9A32